MSSKSERTLLRRLEQNDAILTKLQIGGTFSQYASTDNTAGMFNSTETNSIDFSRLGDYIGENTHLTHLQFVLGDNELDVTEREFFDGLKRNSSIYKLDINFGDQLNNQLAIVEEGGVGHEILNAYQESNRHLSRLYIRFASLQNGGDDLWLSL